MAPQQHLQRLPRPTSMLFDLEMEEVPGHQHELDAEGLQAVQAVSNLVSRAMTAASQAVRDVESACQSLLSQGTRVCAAGLGQLLGNNMGYAVSLRESLGGGAGGQCLRNLRHCCLVLQRPQSVVDNSSSSSTFGGGSSSSSINSIIVDPTFRDQFAIAHPSARYAAVLDSLPAVFVGPASRIPQLVELLCAEMSLAFHAAGIVLPPWRHTKSMLSKWQPRRSVELPAAATAAAVSAVVAVRSREESKQQAAAAEEASAPSSGDSGLLQGAAGPGSSSGFSAATDAGSANSNGCSASGSAGRQQLPCMLRQGSGTSCAAPALESHVGSGAVPVQRQRSFEPLQRVVGGFAVSLAAQQSPLVQ
uniref:Uncharacterized protein n=1 Tax=Tetradesmus obliquus TaxID=3088 RepID=A0A383VS09_TETOB|eukprot:jgi/Sobl393_1/13399/SZX68297.1